MRKSRGASNEQEEKSVAKDRRLYAKFDINMADHPKIMPLSDAAFRALIESTMYARRQLSDGFIDTRIAIAKWGADARRSHATGSRPPLSAMKGCLHRCLIAHLLHQHPTLL